MDPHSNTLKEVNGFFFQQEVEDAQSLYGERILIRFKEEKKVLIVDSRGKSVWRNFEIRKHLTHGYNEGFLGSITQDNLFTCTPSVYSDLIIFYHQRYGVLGMNSCAEVQFKIPWDILQPTDRYLSITYVMHVSTDHFIVRFDYTYSESSTLRLYRKDEIQWERSSLDYLSDELRLSSDGKTLLLYQDVNYVALDLENGQTVAEYERGFMSPIEERLVDYRLSAFVSFDSKVNKFRVFQAGEDGEGGESPSKPWDDFLSKILETAQRRPVKYMLFTGSVHCQTELTCRGVMEPPLNDDGETTGGDCDAFIISYDTLTKRFTFQLYFLDPVSYFLIDFQRSLFFLSKEQREEPDEFNSWGMDRSSLRIYSKIPKSWSPHVHWKYPALQRERYFQIFLILSSLPYVLPLELIYEIMSLITP